MKRVLLFTCLLLLFVNVASAEMPYFIDDDTTNGYLWINDSISAGGENVYRVEKTAGYSPNGDAVFALYDDGSSYDTSKWSSTGNTPTASNGVLTIDGSVTTAIGSQKTFGVGYIAEAKSKRSDTSSNVLLLSFTDATDVNHKVFVRSNDKDNTKVEIQINNGVTQDEIVRQWASVNSYQEYRITRKSSSETLIEQNDGAYSYTATAKITTNDCGVRFSAWGGADVDIDWVRVRKYASNEPTVVVTDKGTYYEVNVSSTDELADYQIPISCSDLDITSSTESIKIQNGSGPEINVSLVTPNDNSYVNFSILKYDISGMGDFNTSVYVDGSSIWNGSVSSGENQINATLSQGAHTWYVNGSATYIGNTTYNNSETWSFIYDSINPSISDSNISPDKTNVANETTVQTNILWSDVNLKDAKFYVDTGSGYVLESNTTFPSSNWFNTSINTTGLVGSSISWKQTATDEAGNKYTYSNSFNVIESELNIYVYDESNGTTILPSSVTIYNEDSSHVATITEATKVASLSYDNVETGKYIVLVDADGYYSRRGIVLVDVTSLTELNIYLPSTSETVIFDSFKLIDNVMLYDNDEITIRLDKPLPNGTDTVYSSYFDFEGIASTYLIATDQYTLYIETPDETISYGWLSPDPDGEISIILNEFEYTSGEAWLDYTYECTDTAASFDYTSSKAIDGASFIISYNNGTEAYNVSAGTDTGSFTYIFPGNATYLIDINVETEDDNKFTMQKFIEIGKSNQRDFFPASFTMMLKSIVVMFGVVVGVIALSSYRADLSVIWAFSLYAFAVYQGWIYGNAITVSILGIIALAAIKKFQRRESRM